MPGGRFFGRRGGPESPTCPTWLDGVIVRNGCLRMNSYRIHLRMRWRIRGARSAGGQERPVHEWLPRCQTLARMIRSARA